MTVDTHEDFSAEAALSELLSAEVVFLNSYWWKASWPEAARKAISINVSCNDIFFWGVADAEELEYDEIQSLYEYWKKDIIWGSAVWCITKRGMMPQKPVYERIKQHGTWDLDSMNLKPNPTDSHFERKSV